VKRSLVWDEVTDLFRKRPARFKAVQYYSKNMDLLPPDVSYMTNPDDNQEVLVVCQGQKVTLLEINDWIVLDIETGKTYVMKEDMFSLIFERV
jgi:hypothetical protein